MPSLSPTPRAELMTADGRLTPVGDGRWGRPKVLLARELCAFERFEPAGAGRSAGLAAARLHARAASPFIEPGVQIRRSGAGFGIWWWDKVLVSRLLQARFGADRIAVAPETLAQPQGHGWRIVLGASGHEAQLWADGELVASAWRREAFSDADWAAFTRVQRNPPEPAPATPPPAQPLPLTPAAAFGFSPLSDMTAGEAGAMAAGVAALAILSFTAFELGQGARHAERARAAEKTAAMTAPMIQPTAGDRRDAERLAGYRALADRPRPMESLAVALDVIHRNGIEPQGFEADGSGVTVILPYSAIGKVEPVSAQLAATGEFTGIRPVTQAGRKAVELHLTPKGATPVA